MTGPGLLSEEWVHVAAVVGDTKQLYVDGELAVEAADATFLANSNQPLTIGAMLDSLFGEELNFFAGMIDDVHIYDHALTIDEIRALYEPGNGGPDEEEIVELVMASDLTGDIIDAVRRVMED